MHIIDDHGRTKTTPITYWNNKGEQNLLVEQVNFMILLVCTLGYARPVIYILLYTSSM